MSLQSLLSIARSALLAHQHAMSVTGHNIANAQTPGYSRQRLELAPESPALTPFGPMGRGVTSTGLSRARSTFLDLAVRSDSGRLGDAGTRLQLLRGLDDALLEPGPDGVSGAFDELLQSFSNLAGEPSSGVNRELVRKSAERFVSQVRRVGASIDAASGEALARLQSEVAEVNQITAEIAEIQSRIGRFGPAESPDLLDRRDALVDRLASFGAVRVLEQADGVLTISLGAETLVAGSTAQDLEVRALGGGGWGVARAGAAGPFDSGPGSLQSLSTLVTTTQPALRARLDAYAAAAVTEVNRVHRLGYTLTGATGVDFFDPAGLTSTGIALSGAVTASTDAIAAAGTAAPGDADNAIALAAIGGTVLAGLGGRTIREHYAVFVSDIGAQVQSADRDVSIHQTLVDRSETRRQSVSGVSLDEEMVNLVAQQQAYSAAARLVQVADEMITELLRMI